MAPFRMKRVDGAAPPWHLVRTHSIAKVQKCISDATAVKCGTMAKS